MSEQKETKPKRGRGGAQPNSGRPAGVTNKITHKELQEAYLKASGGVSFVEHLAEDAIRARSDKYLSLKYQSLIAKYILSEMNDTTVEHKVLPWDGD